MESATKSIIYGNTYKNKYGKFLPVCSSISDRSVIASIVEYLKESPHFSNYNRIAYAYRVQQAPVVFITQKKQSQTTFYEDSFSDETIEGSGEKLLHLLQKFNIRNVMLGILIEQYNPLASFQVTNYRAIVENCRMLLDQLYRKIVDMHDQNQNKGINDLLLHNNRAIKMKKCNINQQVQFPKQPAIKTKQRPNHIYSSGKPVFLQQKTAIDGNSHEVNFLWDRCKIMKQQYDLIVNSYTDKELQQLKYFVMYDRNVLLNTVINMFIIYLGVDKNFVLSQFDFNSIRSIPFENIEVARLRKMQDMVRTNRKLNVDTVMAVNRAMGILFSQMELAIRFSKTLQRITDLLAKSEQQKKAKTQTSKPDTTVLSIKKTNTIQVQF